MKFDLKINSKLMIVLAGEYNRVVRRLSKLSREAPRVIQEPILFFRWNSLKISAENIWGVLVGTHCKYFG